MKCSKRAQKFPLEEKKKKHCIYKNGYSNNYFMKSTERIWLHSICMQVVNLWSGIKGWTGWINFQSLIFINSSFRKKKYKEMTQLPSELHPWAAVLQSQVHNVILIDQERAHTFSEKVSGLNYNNDGICLWESRLYFENT